MLWDCRVVRVRVRVRVCVGSSRTRVTSFLLIFFCVYKRTHTTLHHKAVPGRRI